MNSHLLGLSLYYRNEWKESVVGCWCKHECQLLSKVTTHSCINGWSTARQHWLCVIDWWRPHPSGLSRATSLRLIEKQGDQPADSCKHTAPTDNINNQHEINKQSHGRSTYSSTLINCFKREGTNFIRSVFLFWHRLLALVHTDVSEKRAASIFRV